MVRVECQFNVDRCASAAAPEAERDDMPRPAVGTDGYFADTVVGLPSSPTKTTKTLAGTLPLLKS